MAGPISILKFKTTSNGRQFELPNIKLNPLIHLWQRLDLKMDLFFLSKGGDDLRIYGAKNYYFFSAFNIYKFGSSVEN